MTHPYLALLRGVLQSPGEDDRRLVLADWLEENGEGERSAFIRVQVELARDGCRCTYSHHNRSSTCPLCRRERELLAARSQGIPWLGFRPPLKMTWWWGRGFVQRVELTAADFLAHAPAIFSAQPVERVTLTTRPEVWQNAKECWLEGRRRWDKWSKEMGGPSCVDLVPYLLAAEWPRVTFALPRIDA